MLAAMEPTEISKAIPVEVLVPEVTPLLRGQVDEKALGLVTELPVVGAICAGCWHEEPNVRHERQTQAQLEAVRSMEGLGGTLATLRPICVDLVEFLDPALKNVRGISTEPLRQFEETRARLHVTRLMNNDDTE